MFSKDKKEDKFNYAHDKKIKRVNSVLSNRFPLGWELVTRTYGTLTCRTPMQDNKTKFTNFSEFCNYNEIIILTILSQM